MPKRILVIEDSKPLCRHYLKLQSPEVVIVVAEDHNEAYACIEGGGWDLVLMDGSLNPNLGGGCDTEELVQELKKCGHTGPIIANSTSPVYAKHLVTCGCTASPSGGKVTPDELLAIIATL